MDQNIRNNVMVKVQDSAGGLNHGWHFIMLRRP